MPKKPTVAEPAWPADKVERRPVETLIPYARNSRVHDDAQVAQIAASIREWGWTIPVLVDEAGMLIAGHGRVLAARQLGLADVPCMVAVGWSEAQKRAYVIADNKLATNASWDQSLLKVELADLLDTGFNVDLVGFELEDLSSALDFAGGGDGGTEALIDLTSPNGGESKTLKLVFGSKSAPMTQQEHDALVARFAAHVNEWGVPNGFVTRLLNVQP